MYQIKDTKSFLIKCIQEPSLPKKILVTRFGFTEVDLQRIRDEKN